MPNDWAPPTPATGAQLLADLGEFAVRIREDSLRDAHMREVNRLLSSITGCEFRMVSDGD